MWAAAGTLAATIWGWTRQLGLMAAASRPGFVLRAAVGFDPCTAAVASGCRGASLGAWDLGGRSMAGPLSSSTPSSSPCSAGQESPAGAVAPQTKDEFPDQRCMSVCAAAMQRVPLRHRGKKDTEKEKEKKSHDGSLCTQKQPETKITATKHHTRIISRISSQQQTASSL